MRAFVYFYMHDHACLCFRALIANGVECVCVRSWIRPGVCVRKCMCARPLTLIVVVICLWRTAVVIYSVFFAQRDIGRPWTHRLNYRANYLQTGL